MKRWKNREKKVDNLNEKVREANSHFNRASTYKKKIEEEGNRVSFNSYNPSTQEIFSRFPDNFFYNINPRQLFLAFLLYLEKWDIEKPRKLWKSCYNFSRLF